MFNLETFYSEIQWPVFRGTITESQEIGLTELLSCRDDWTPAELATALALAYERTDGTMRNAKIRRQRYREPIVNERLFKLALGGQRSADIAMHFQDALIKSEWGV